VQPPSICRKSILLAAWALTAWQAFFAPQLVEWIRVTVDNDPGPVCRIWKQLWEPGNRQWALSSLRATRNLIAQLLFAVKWFHTAR
jgi:hypothetical protein